ncbi:MAG: DUF4097 family beta strand repeat-containing protein, partial [Bacteroidota bacterium]
MKLFVKKKSPVLLSPKFLIYSGLLFLLSYQLHGQKTSDTIKENLDFEGKSTIVVWNINGGIQVESHDGNEINLEVTRTYTARNKTLLEKAKQELKVKTTYFGDTLVIAIDPPCDERNRNWKKGWHGNVYWNGCEWDPKYEFHMSFKLKVPRQSSLILSTVHEGLIEVKNVTGDLCVNHVHGDIDLKQVSGAVEARTIHGDIDLQYSSPPVKDAFFYAHHGDIEMKLPSNSAAKLFFKSHDGDFYTDADESALTAISDTRQKTEGDEEQGIIYRISNRSGVQLRNGETVIDFETWHG